jgi:hypothetical protein
MRFTKLSTVLILFVCLAVSAGQASAGGFLEDQPWLADRSAWSESTTAGGGLRGWWAVGNSRVFGIVGADMSSAMIHQITGPHIMLAGVMNNGSAFGPAKLSLSIAGQPVAFAKQTLSRVRGTGIVVMDLVSPEVTMTVINYAPFDVNALLRTVVIKNTGATALNDVVLQASVGRTVVQDGQLFDSFKGSTDGAAMGQTRQLFSSFIEPAEAAATAEKLGTLTVKIGTLEPGAEALRTQYLVFSMQEIGDEAATLARVKTEGTKLLKKTYDDWAAWLAGTARLSCPDQRLVDLIDDTKILVKVQTADPQGAAGPMEFFAGVWVRDSNGPFRYYVRMGDFEAAKKMLEFNYRAAAYTKFIPNWRPMDIDVTKPVDPGLDWSTVPTDRVETPSWLIMQHAWYYRFTGDIEPIRQHWGYLKRCLMGQLIDDKGKPFTTVNYAYSEPRANKDYRFPHHGDETWIYPGFEVLNSAVFPEPNDHPNWDEFSADSTWEFVTSAAILADFAEKLGKTAEAGELAKIAKDSRAACERDYWMPERGIYAPAMDMHTLDVHQPPFTMVNLNPLWIGYLKPDDPKATSNVVKTMEYTRNPNYVTNATETLRVYVGMQPGMFLYNLAAIDYPYAERALKALVEVASPTGEYTEKEVTEPTNYSTQFWGHRIRPWEGGINMDAAYYYLTGLDPDMGNGRVALCPRLPFGWNQMSVLGQPLGDGKLDIQVTDDGARRNYTLKWTGSKPIGADFKISLCLDGALSLAKITSVKINGAAAKVAPKRKWFVTTADLNLSLAPGKETVVTVQYQKEKPPLDGGLRPMPQRYEYIVPKNIPYHDIVLWSSEPRKTRPEDVGPYDLLKSKLKVRLISPITPSNADWLRPFLLKSNGQPNARLFLMGTGSIANSLKYAKWWGNPGLTKLFTDYMKAGGVIVAVKGGETTSELFGKLLTDGSYFIVPTAATPVLPVGAAGKQACDVLKLFTGDKKPTATGMYVYKNMVVLARPEPEKNAGTMMARSFGKGFFLSMLLDLDVQQFAALGATLAQPQTLSALGRIISGAEPQGVKGAFEDYGKDGVFSDDFKSYQTGSVGLPVWLPLSGVWKIQDGQYHEIAGNSYDFCTTANAKIKGDYTIEVSSTLVEGIFESGVVFNLPTRFSMARSQMVRFCGGSALWCGPLQGGFSLEHDIPTGVEHVPKDFHMLKVTVYNSKGTYDLAVDGKEIAKDLKLTVKPKSADEGFYVGLISCRGHVAYNSVKVTPL